jgi:hypothetical protein
MIPFLEKSSILSENQKSILFVKCVKEFDKPLINGVITTNMRYSWVPRKGAMDSECKKVDFLNEEEKNIIVLA